MTDENFDFMNEVIERGTIVAKKENINYTLLTIASDLSPVFEGGERVWKRNYPHLFCTGEVKEKCKNFKVKDVVQVSGYVQTRKGKIGDKETYLLGLNATDIEEAPRVYIDGNVASNGKVYEPEINEVRLAGRVGECRIINENLISLRVIMKYEKDGSYRQRSVEVLYRTNVAEFTKEILPGDYIYVLGFIQTREPDPNKARRTEWLSAREIIKASERSGNNVQES